MAYRICLQEDLLVVVTKGPLSPRPRRHNPVRTHTPLPDRAKWSLSPWVIVVLHSSCPLLQQAIIFLQKHRSPSTIHEYLNLLANAPATWLVQLGIFCFSLVSWSPRSQKLSHSTVQIQQCKEYSYSCHLTTTWIHNIMRVMYACIVLYIFLSSAQLRKVACTFKCHKYKRIFLAAAFLCPLPSSEVFLHSGGLP